MIHVLVANRDKEEGERWSSQLKKSGYYVAPECLNLSMMVYILSRVKIHFVVCSTNLVENNACVVLNSVIKFFPRVKIILVGKPQCSDIASLQESIANVVVKKEFDAELERYIEPFWETASDNELNPEDAVLRLLDGHFLSREGAAMLLGRSQPKWVAGYVVISIVTDSQHSRAFRIISRMLIELKRGSAFRFRPDEVCVVLDNSSSEDACYTTADILRSALLTKTDAMFSIGISRRRASAAELYVCEREARRAASAKHLYGNNSVIHIDYLGDNDIEYVYPAHKENRLIEQTIDGNKDEALKMLGEIFEVFKGRNNLKQSIVNKFALGILVKLNIAAASMSGAFEKIQMDSLSLGELMAAKTLSDTYLFLKAGVEDFANEMDAFADIRRDALYMQLSGLKDGKAELTVSDLISVFHTTVCFLNRSVAQNTGGNIFDFLYNL